MKSTFQWQWFSINIGLIAVIWQKRKSRCPGWLVQKQVYLDMASFCLFLRIRGNLNMEQPWFCSIRIWKHSNYLYLLFVGSFTDALTLVNKASVKVQKIFKPKHVCFLGSIHVCSTSKRSDQAAGMCRLVVVYGLSYILASRSRLIVNFSILHKTCK